MGARFVGAPSFWHGNIAGTEKFWDGGHMAETAESWTRQRQGGGLRERKKEATRQAFSQAALRLAVERGWDEVRIEHTAAEGDVSARTFNNYFFSKEAALLCQGLDRAARVRDAMAARPADEPLWEALTNALVEMVVAEERELGQAAVVHAKLVTAHPALAARQLLFDREAIAATAAAIAWRTG